MKTWHAFGDGRAAFAEIILVFAWLVACSTAGAATNPILPGVRADPEINYFEGKYWVYPTAQTVNGSSSFRTYSSSNLVDWADEGEVFNLGPVTWAETGGWAPSVAVRNGTYYFYFAVGGTGGQNSLMGVASGATPKGPFTDALGAPLLASKTTAPTIEAIDPHVFIDDDGLIYLYYGGSWGTSLGVQQLNTNMISLTGPLNVYSGISGFTEGPFMIKRNGTYYLSYSSGTWSDWTYHLRYATAPSPLGPWTYRGQILTGDATHLGSGHHSFVKEPGSDTWHVAYHYWDNLFSGRHVGLDDLNFNPDGTIQPVTMTGGGSIMRWQAYSDAGKFITQSNFRGTITANMPLASDAQFFVVPGLASSDPAAVSFASIRYPNRYLRHRSGQIWLDTYDGTALFEADATFFVRPGQGNAAFTSFESYNFPGQYIRHRNGLLYREALPTAGDKNEGTFMEQLLYPVPLARAPILRHRWSFNDGTGRDSVGGADAGLVGSANYAGGKLQLPGGAAQANCATVNITNTLATNANLTIECWFTMNTLQNWSKVWMFGAPSGGVEKGLAYADFTPRAGADGNVPSLSLNSALSGIEVNTRAGANPSLLATGIEYHAASVYNATSNTMYLYLNGALVDSSPMSGGDFTQLQATEAWFGAAVFFGDACLNGAINEMRIWDGPLSAGQVAMHYALGPNALPQPTLAVAAMGGEVVLSWPETFPGYALEAAATPGSSPWNPVSAVPVLTNGQYVVELSATNAVNFYRLKE